MISVFGETHLTSNKEKIRIFLSAAALAVMAAAFLLYLLESRGFFVDEDRYDAVIARAAQRHKLDPLLIKAVIAQESVFDAKTVGGAGEIGLMQILPSGSVTDWARHYKRKVPRKVFLFDPELNIEIGSWYLKRAMNRWKKYKHCTELALCQYNAGESRANKWKPASANGRVIDNITIGSTKTYVKRIMNKYRDYKDAQVAL